jgi:hypothetical protein
MKTELLRAFLLEPGDMFLYLGIKRKVISNDGLYITYSSYNDFGNSFSGCERMGANSKERIELVISKIL